MQKQATKTKTLHLNLEVVHIVLEVVVMKELKYYNQSATGGRGKRGRESCYFFGFDIYQQQFQNLA